MNLQSLSLRTEPMLRSFESKIAEKPEYIVIHIPQNPFFRWGNYLIFREPPKPGDVERWKAIFAREVSTPPTVKHLTFAWDSVRRAGGDRRVRGGGVQARGERGPDCDKRQPTAQAQHPVRAAGLCQQLGPRGVA